MKIIGRYVSSDIVGVQSVYLYAMLSFHSPTVYSTTNANKQMQVQVNRANLIVSLGCTLSR